MRQCLIACAVLLGLAVVPAAGPSARHNDGATIHSADGALAAIRLVGRAVSGGESLPGIQPALAWLTTIARVRNATRSGLAASPRRISLTPGA